MTGLYSSIELPLRSLKSWDTTPFLMCLNDKQLLLNSLLQEVHIK